MKRYDSYKDSEVEWIGEIPSHWDLKTNKYFTQSQKNKSEKGEEELLSVSEYHGVIPRRNIRESEEHLTRSESLEGYLKVRKGELVSNIILMWKRGLGVSEFEGIVSPYYSVFSFLNSEPKYFHYLFRTDQYVSEFRRNSTGVIESRLRLYDDSFGSLKSHYPPLPEQQQIVSYLDTKTSQIDSLIEKTKLKIQLLKENRTSLINELVTKGLNPNVEMKDSGVKWIGEIPRGWKFVKVGHYSTVVRGGSPRPSGDPRFFNGDYIHWITVKDITSKSGKYVTDTETKLTEEGMKQSRVLEPETLVLTNSGGTLGVPGILKIKGCINDGSIGFLNLSKQVERDFLYYFWTTQTKLLLEQQSGYGQPNLNIDIVSNIRFPLPSLSEQTEIVSYLDEHTQLIDKTVSVEERRIDTLKEYRQSLISEVVTGKRKVVD